MCNAVLLLSLYLSRILIITGSSVSNNGCANSSSNNSGVCDGGNIGNSKMYNLNV